MILEGIKALRNLVSRGISEELVMEFQESGGARPQGRKIEAYLYVAGLE